MDIETKTAQLETLSVTIQALHVNGKQMTLAVFRQLPIAKAYNEDGSLAPLEHWGLVRYSIKDEGSLWAVCVSGGRLYRAKVRSGNLDSEYYENALKNAKNDLGWLDYTISYKNEHGRSSREEDWPYEFKYLCLEKAIEKAEEMKNKIIELELCLSVSKRYEGSVRTLMDLPQLFIAV